MTETLAEPAQREPRGSRLDAWWGRMLSTPTRRRAWDWGGPAVVTLIAALTRLWDLGHPHSLVFDETFYVKDAYTLLNLGYEAKWPEGADTEFNAGNPDVYTTDGSFVVHPPLGKWIIALGLAVFGAESSVGWRVGTAVVGILGVVLLMVVAKRLFRSTLLTVLAGFLFAIEGSAIVMSRVAILDNMVMLFALAGFLALLLDRDWVRRRLADRALGDSGPALWWRPWLLTMGVLLGLASAVKWSGFYFLAFFALASVVLDVLDRRRAGVPFWFSGTVLKQAPVSFLLTVPTALAAHLATWTGWFLTDGGYYRQWAAEAGNAATGFFSWVPLPLQSFWHYQVSTYSYHVNEHSPHSYSANPLTWLLMVRPTSMYYRGSELDENGCTISYCAESITGIANPLIWWAATAAVLFLVWRLVRYREERVGLILLGVAAGYLPWLLYLERTVYQFYTIAFEPWLLLALVQVMALLLGTRDDPSWRRVSGIRLIGGFLVVAVLLSAYFWPLWTGLPISWDFLRSHYWLPTWR